MPKDDETIREQFIGDVVRHTSGGIVRCSAHPDYFDVDFGPHNCEKKIEAGDSVIVHYGKVPEKGDTDWLDIYQFCANCDDAKSLPSQRREVGKEQAVVEG